MAAVVGWRALLWWGLLVLPNSQDEADRGKARNALSPKGLHRGAKVPDAGGCWPNGQKTLVDTREQRALTSIIDA